jgi:nucleotide-binding universal stress UspA family protein
MKNNKYKILVLSDLNDVISKTLLNSVSLAKIVNADINFFYVIKPTEVVEKESQLSAMRTINQEYVIADKKIKDLINKITEDYNVKINHAFTFGNIKNEIGKYIDEYKPDIIVLGKRKPKIVNFVGDNITQFILKKHKGIIMISDDNNALDPNKELALGLFNNTNTYNRFTEEIISSTQKPLTTFSIADNPKTVKKETFLKDIKTVEYVFEKGDNVMNNISNYLSKSNINLLFVNRESGSEIPVKPNINQVINHLNCSLILTT